MQVQPAILIIASVEIAHSALTTSQLVFIQNVRGHFGSLHQLYYSRIKSQGALETAVKMFCL